VKNEALKQEILGLLGILMNASPEIVSSIKQSNLPKVLGEDLKQVIS
jgi:hypothetical protein